MTNLNSTLEFSRIALGMWNKLSARDKARVKLNFRAWIADARAERLAA